MGLPGHRRTSSDKRRRSAHFALAETTINTCPKCQKAVQPHRACAFCGTYKGKQVLDVAKRTSRSTRKAGKK
ncbi:MAG: 50S ribosomal protein L32 [Candidatus Magasanikbacteria bacterium GW2011_GWC2_34_16]|uniref:Large ribosomal subunit protein bL32 n=2 Tax=Candidatus Magasanikiibacteriota TaxID=1752731 RepID=A0A0G0HPF8_9BACT|nr:MAG: 50S ribosomal protein L32 [Candidatus Magasanikbacteria bacterium GW2011_GWC2_34_16]KKQ40490.1 MAG: 50S ribosomal protein L32 [Candidatus Magasanikbacteria bacterium GW2011_GWA2_37_8]